jgi:peroxiredoxin
MGNKLKPGDVVPPRVLIGVSGAAVAMPDPVRLVHLQFRRFAGCPICNLHLRSFAQRLAEVDAAGVREVVVFHSTDAEMRRYEDHLPFAAIGDAEKKLYREFGVEAGPGSLLHPRALLAILRSIVPVTVETIARRRQVANLSPHGGRLGLPADFLIATDGRVLAAKYGTHADDQWSVNEVIALAQAARS